MTKSADNAAANEERAIQAAIDALIPELRAHGFFWSAVAGHLARTVINAYIAAKCRAEHAASDD